MQKHRETQSKLVSSHFPSNTVAERSEIDDEVDSFIESEHDPCFGRGQQHMHSKSLATVQQKKCEVYSCLSLSYEKIFADIRGKFADLLKASSSQNET